MSDSKNGLPIDPKELVPAVGGFVLGFGIVAFFVLLAMGMGLTLFVDKADIPLQ
jgi:hypothetical protein